jgi:hypothetical protein
MKIKGLVVALVLFLAVTRLHGIGLGLQFNFEEGDISASVAALVLSPSDRTHLAVSWHIAEEVNTFWLTGDYYAIGLPIMGSRQASLYFTLGVGLFSNIEFNKGGGNDHGIDGGVRAPVGLNLMLLGNIFEIYFHVAPSFGVQFAPKLDLTNLFFPVALGGRFWFR